MEKDTDKELWKNYRKRMDTSAIYLSFMNHLHYTRAKDEFSATDFDRYLALAYTVKDRIVERWSKTQQTYYNEDVKRVYWLSLEFLLGKALLNNILNLKIIDEVKYIVKKTGCDFSKLIELEPDAGLGNGGLGRLSACFLDSMATMELPGYGYGLRYEFGIFRQVIRDGFQVEEPEEWLKYTYPWEVERPEYTQTVEFGGEVITETDEFGRPRFRWINTQKILAVPFDIPIIGYGTNTVNTLRLWSAKASNQFDLHIFQHGDYIKAVEDKNISENISKVLYPNDNIYEGKELRFKQEYFFVSATLQDIIRRYLKTFETFDKFPEKVAIHLNDTHPALSICELMRLLLDVYNLKWEKAWEITVKTFSFTNHTVLPEALEKWPISLFQKLLPRHLQIVYEINRRFLMDVSRKYPGDIAKARWVSIVEDGADKQVKMANLAIISSHKVNGVSKLHTKILKNDIFKDFHEMYPEKFLNITNGISQRRWLLVANHYLSDLIIEKIGDGWVRNLNELKKLEQFIEDEDFLISLYKVKEANKKNLSNYIKEKTAISVDPQSIFDAQIKRMHEYKRQLLNILHIIHLYHKLKENPNMDFHPRTFVFAGKSAPGYFMAKLIIRLINGVAEVINTDKQINEKLKVVFLADYNVSLAEKIIPASDVNEQISTAGWEASGTGNMKFSLNGSIIVGTLDGANIEIMEKVGRENIYIFGLTAEEILEMTKNMSYNPFDYYNKDPEIKAVVDSLVSGLFSRGDKGLFKPIYQNLLFGYEGSAPDRYFHLADFRSYAETHKKVDKDFRDKLAWQKKALKNIANTGYFSSDRAIQEYSEKIWNVKPIKVKI